MAPYRSYSDKQQEAKLVICATCKRPFYFTHPRKKCADCRAPKRPR